MKINTKYIVLLISILLAASNTFAAHSVSASSTISAIRISGLNIEIVTSENQTITLPSPIDRDLNQSAIRIVRLVLNSEETELAVAYNIDHIGLLYVWNLRNRSCKELTISGNHHNVLTAIEPIKSISYDSDGKLTVVNIFSDQVYVFNTETGIGTIKNNHTNCSIQ